TVREHLYVGRAFQARQVATLTASAKAPASLDEAKRRRKGSPYAVLLAAIVSACCGAPPPQTSEPAAPMTVEVARVIEQPVNVTLSMPGQLDPDEVVAVFSKVTGFVKTIAVDRGSRVRVGDVLATLEAPELS